jgi:hypothetical protein
MKFDLDGRVLGFTAACSLLTRFVFGTAWRSKPQIPIERNTREGGRGSAVVGTDFEAC